MDITHTNGTAPTGARTGWPATATPTQRATAPRLAATFKDAFRADGAGTAPSAMPCRRWADAMPVSWWPAMPFGRRVPPTGCGADGLRHCYGHTDPAADLPPERCCEKRPELEREAGPLPGATPRRLPRTCAARPLGRCSVTPLRSGGMSYDIDGSPFSTPTGSRAPARPGIPTGSTTPVASRGTPWPSGADELKSRPRYREYNLRRTDQGGATTPHGRGLLPDMKIFLFSPKAVAICWSPSSAS